MSNQFNPSVHSSEHCIGCTRQTSHREVLLAIPTRSGWHFTRDIVCLTCGLTFLNGYLPDEPSETFCLPSAEPARKIHLPFGPR